MDPLCLVIINPTGINIGYQFEKTHMLYANCLCYYICLIQTSFFLQMTGGPNTTSVTDWIKEHAGDNATVGSNPSYMYSGKV